MITEIFKRTVAAGGPGLGGPGRPERAFRGRRRSQWVLFWTVVGLVGSAERRLRSALTFR